MNSYTVYKLLDKSDKVVWVGLTSLPLAEKEQQHKFHLMEFERAAQVGEPFQSKEEARAEVDRVLKECIDRDGHLPLYVLMRYCKMLPPGKKVVGAIPKGAFFPTVVDAA